MSFLGLSRHNSKHWPVFLVVQGSIACNPCKKFPLISCGWPDLVLLRAAENKHSSADPLQQLLDAETKILFQLGQMHLFQAWQELSFYSEMPLKELEVSPIQRPIFDPLFDKGLRKPLDSY